MNLSSYLNDNKISYSDFGASIGATVTTVYRYAKGIRIPKEDVMQLIYRVTDGAVTANDFYGLSGKPKKSKSKKEK